MNKIHNGGVAIAMIPDDMQAPSSYIDVVELWGSIPRSYVTNFASSYLFSDTVIARRAQQDDNLAFDCLWSSLGTKLLQTIMLLEEKWTLKDPNGILPDKRSAILLLQTIIEESSIQTNVTTTAIRTRLASLNEHMLVVGSDIGVFNQYVAENLAALTARGEQTHDLLVNLWRAYKCAEDAPFNNFIVRMNEDYNMGRMTITPRELMDTAHTYFKTAVEAKNWQKPTAADRTIIALKAEVEALNKRAADQQKRKGGGKKGTPGKGKKEKPVSDKPYALQHQVAPADLKKVIKWRKHDYHWCCAENGGKCGGKWRAHLPSECKGADFLKRKREEESSPSPPTKKQKGGTGPIIRAVAALAGLNTEE